MTYPSTMTKLVDPGPPILDRREAAEPLDAGVCRPVAPWGGLLEDDSDETGLELPPAETENRGRGTIPAIAEGWKPYTPLWL